MRIAFDAKRAFSNGTGLGQYSRNLIEGMGRYFPHHQYYLFAGNPGKDRYPPPVKGMITVRPPGLWSRFPAGWRTWACRSAIRKYQVNLFHGLSHELPRGLPRKGLAKVVTMHDLIYERFPEQYPWIDRKIYRAKGRHACRIADRVVAISQHTARDLEEIYRVPARKIRVCYQSCSPRFALKAKQEDIDSVRSVYALPPDYFLYVGSLIERKNLLGLLEAMAEIPEQRRMPLVVVGAGTAAYEARVRQFLKEKNMEDQVLFMKDKAASAASQAQLANDLPLLYQGARALIYPSFYEGFGIPVLEAMSSGTPVISSSSSCLRETGGEAPLYVDPGDPGSIKAAMERLIDDPQQGEALVKKGLEQAARFSLEACTRPLVKVYEEMF